METRSNHVLVGAAVLILLLVLAFFIVWLARLSGADEKEYDIFFRQSVVGLAKGSEVASSGVPAGQLRELHLCKPDPPLLSVHCSIYSDFPLLRDQPSSRRPAVH